MTTVVPIRPDVDRSARRSRVDWPAWTLAWLGLAGAAFANAALRQAYSERLGDRRAHQLSSLTLPVLMAPVAERVERRHPIGRFRDAVRVGLVWAGLTVAFELAFGRWAAGESWRELAEAYDLEAGELWPLDVVAVAAAPAATRWWHRRLSERPRPGPAHRARPAGRHPAA